MFSIVFIFDAIIVSLQCTAAGWDGKDVQVKNCYRNAEGSPAGDLASPGVWSNSRRESAIVEEHHNAVC